MSVSANTGAGAAKQPGQKAKQEASATAGQAGQAAGQAAGTAAEQSRAVADKAREQGRSAGLELRDRIAEEASEQTRRSVSTLRQWADDLSGMADRAPEGSSARGLVMRTADGGHRAANYLDQRGVQGLLDDTQEFARRRPGVFLGAMALAGFAVGRLARSDGSPSGTAEADAPAPPARSTTGHPAEHGTPVEPNGQGTRYEAPDRRQPPGGSTEV